jgi:hypothetical protein
MSALQAVSASGYASGHRPVRDLLARWRELLPRLINPSLLLLRSSELADEVVVARFGRVEIHQTLAGWSLETCVKGEPERARATGLRRLANYVVNRNRSEAGLRAARPVVQMPEAPNRWRVRIGLAGANAELLSDFARNGKVRLRAAASETLAVIRVPGRPTPLAMQHAETAIRLALAPTRWEAAGAAMLRLHAVPPVLPFLGRFEVAVPVTERTHSTSGSASLRSIAFRHPVGQETPTPSSPPVH